MSLLVRMHQAKALRRTPMPHLNQTGSMYSVCTIIRCKSRWSSIQISVASIVRTCPSGSFTASSIDRHRVKGYDTIRRQFSGDAKPFSRRKGGGAPSSPSSSSGSDFNVQAALAIVQIYRAVEGLIPMNKGYSLSTTSHMNVIEEAAVLVKKGVWADCEPIIKKLAYADQPLSLTLGVAERGTLFARILLRAYVYAYTTHHVDE
jgi:hypothetical protein